MKWIRIFAGLSSMFIMLLTASCGGGGGSGDLPDGVGSVSMYLTDAKPALPESIKSVFITFDEILAHKSGGGWENLTLVETPYRIDLLQFHSGHTTEFVPPTELTYGKYTQIRLVISGAEIVLNDDTTIPIFIPSDKLRTDKNFLFTVDSQATVDIVIDFDLSQSLSKSGDGSYQIKPVLHINESSLAATIQVNIDNANFVDGEKTIVKVIALSNDEEYTRVEVEKSGGDATTFFNIYWLVPNQSYDVEFDFDSDGNTDHGPVTIDSEHLKPGEIAPLIVEDLTS